MIPKEIQALFKFIDYLDENKREYIEKYIPLYNELKELNKQRSELNPKRTYKGKQQYDIVQKQIEEKFKPILENIYNPVTSKLRELGIWSGDDTYASIHNNNISTICDFQRNFIENDVEQVIKYKQKYLSFRNKTNSDFFCLTFVFHGLDEILKELFDFFKDTNENEFDSFEAKTIKVKNIEELTKIISEGREKNLKFYFPMEVFSNTKNEKQTMAIPTNINTEVIMGDKFNVDNISNNKGQISIGKEIKTIVNEKDKIAKKSFFWQKWGTITGFFISIFK
ncbi:hypothetical protein NU10_00120 [Flavobacterium dauae]|uniref:hypothetical protein n=1 Tax=Flavobacterium dauae TaxID=1563479 RepID=UPI00101B2992|nr:hypothetical protein [Flavobacterium dauae]WLD23839.1 hypothetical protein NU10_00120 [Flavobacterium dauae]